MKAMIFNSGSGQRMGEFCHHHHKSMAQLENGETIFERQLRLLQQHDITQIVVTTGSHAEQLHQKASLPCFSNLTITFVHNPDYRDTNYIYSMYLAREFCQDDMIILHGDLVFSQNLLKRVLSHPSSNIGLIDPTRCLPEKDFKARVIDQRIVQVSVDIFQDDCVAFQPLYRLDHPSVQAWLDQVVHFVEQGQVTVYADNALNPLLLNTLHITALSYQDEYIDEVDTLLDLQRVSRDIRLFDFSQQAIFTPADSCFRLEDMLKKHPIQRPMLVVGKSFASSSSCLSQTIHQLPYDFILFDEFSSNPTYDQILQGVALFKTHQCDFLLAIGGGSAIDVAKGIKLYSALDDSTDPFPQNFLYSPVPLFAIPSTAGTGSESTRFSVIYVNDLKQSLTHDSIFPNYVLLEPTLLSTLPLFHKKCTLLDALCQCIEAIWSMHTTPTAQEYATQGIQLILKHYEAYLREDDTVYASILLASNLSGRAINLSQTTAAHAMSYKLSSLYAIPHGYAVALCLPSLLRYMIHHQKQAHDVIHFNAALQQLCGIFGVSSPLSCADAIERFIATMDLPGISLQHPDDLALLVSSVNQTRLKNNPVPLSDEAIAQLYQNSLSTP